MGLRLGQTALVRIFSVELETAAPEVDSDGVTSAYARYRGSRVWSVKLARMDVRS